jgi:hypothetical protein
MSRAYVSEGHWSRPSLAPSRSQIVPPVVMLFHLPVKSADVTQGSADVEPPPSRGGVTSFRGTPQPSMAHFSSPRYYKC